MVEMKRVNPIASVRTLALYTGVGVLILGLSACSGRTRTGMDRTRPNELAVARAAPLVVPPEFNLVPPAPGQPRPQDVDPSTQALTVMFGGQAARSGGEAGTISAAGGSRAEPGIRSTVGDPETQTVHKGEMTTQVLNAPESDGQAGRVAVPQAAPQATPAAPNSPK